MLDLKNMESFPVKLRSSRVSQHDALPWAQHTVIAITQVLTELQVELEQKSIMPFSCSISRKNE